MPDIPSGADNVMTSEMARCYAYGRAFAEVGIALAREEQRTANLQERLAMAEADIEKIQKTIGHMICAPILSPEELACA